ncbi:MAG: NAD(P)-dependent oxidoreductase [Sulfuritalea sp.]|nr:NAD(P)-dependent oxidoreductase [Sulfuritalea sp.]
MALVVLGAMGFLGRHLLAAATSAGLPVRAITRGFIPPAADAIVDWASVDVHSAASLAAVIEEGDIVVNLAFAQDEEANIRLINALLEACNEKRASCLIHCSTAMVVGVSSALLITEEARCAPLGPYERIKVALEQKVIEARRHGLRTIIVRPTAIVGPGGANLRTLACSLLSDSAAWNYVRASLFGNRPMHLVPVATVVSAILHLVAASDRYGNETFIIAADDDSDNRFPRVERLLAASLGLPSRKVPVFPLPRILLSSILTLRGRSDPAIERVYSSGKLRATGFVPSPTVAEAVTDFGNWYRRVMTGVEVASSWQPGSGC